MSNPVIRRYFSRPGMLEKVSRDFKLLIQRANRFPDEYVIQLRENYFNVYHKGMSLAKITPRNGRYKVSISDKFLWGDLREKMSAACGGRTHDRGANTEFDVDSSELRRFLQVDHLKSLKSNITMVGYSEELEFEQVLMTDNPASDTFIIIDRQIQDRLWGRALDLLALVRTSGTGPFHFLVIEVKTGKNPELSEEVGQQLHDYVEHIGDYIQDYVDCYTENYRQKKFMGLLGDYLPAEIQIEHRVEGMVVTGGYSHLAEEATATLQKRFDVRVQIMKNVIIPSR